VTSGRPGSCSQRPAHRVRAPVELHRRAVVAAGVERKTGRSADLGRLLVGQPDRLLRADEGDKPLHHVHLHVAVDREVAAELVGLRVLVPVVGLLVFLELRR
jgi:hypothetical protein